MSIGDLCTTTFNEQDIEASKRRLFELCADDSCTRMRKRTGPKRSAQNIDDIIRLLHEKGTDTPTFVARDLGKLPPVTFDSIDVSALLHSIRQNEAAINVLKDCVTTQQASAKTIVGVVNNVVSRISAVELRQPSVRNAAIRPVVPAAIAVPASTSAVPVSASPAAANDDEDDTSSETATTNALSDTPSLDPEREDWPDLGEQPSWSTVAGRRNTKAKAQQPKRQQQPRQQQQQPQQRAQTTTNTKPSRKGITGRAKGSGIKSASVKRFANIFATRFERHVTATDVRNYLNQRLGRGMTLTVEAVPTKFDGYSSFHITCECPDTAVFMDPSLWPENIFVRWWRNPRASHSPSPPSEIPGADDTTCFPPSPPPMISRAEDDTCVPPSLPSSSSRADDDTCNL